MKVTSSSGINIFGLSILLVVSFLMFTLLFISQYYNYYSGSVT